MIIEAGSLVAREREVDRSTDRQSDVSRQIIALTKNVIEAGSLVDLLIEEINFRLAIKADSLVARERQVDWFTDRQSDELIIALTKSVIEAGSLVDQLIEEIGLNRAFVAGSLFAQKREVDRFTDRQSDESRQIIALTKNVIEAGSLFAQKLERDRFTDRQSDELIIALTKNVIEADSL